jgi:hypothetical protein
MVLPTVVLCIRDERSRAVCSLLLRHQGFRAVEGMTATETVDLAVTHGAELVVADLDLDERTAMHKDLVTRLPGVILLFVHQKQSLERLEQAIRASLRRPADNPSAN